MIKNAFYITLKARFILKISKYMPWTFGHAEKRLNWNYSKDLFKLEHTSVSIAWSFVQFVFIVCPSQWPLNILSLGCWPLALTVKTEGSLERFSLNHFLHDFEEKYFSRYSLLIDQISLFDCLYFVKYWAMCVFQVFVNSEINHIFLMKTFS